MGNRKMIDKKASQEFERLSRNIKNLIGKSGVQQIQIADEFGISAQTVNNYCNNKAVPTLKFMWLLKNKMGISIDDMLEKEILPSSGFDIQTDINKYIGTYAGYYVDTVSKIELSLNRAVILLDKSIMKTGTSNLSVKAIFSLSETEANEVFEEFQRGDFSCLSNSELESKIYTGDVEFTNEFIYLKLIHKNKDKVMIIFHRVNSNKNIFCGGIGTMNSVSKGRDNMPTIQYIGISRQIIQCSDEEILRQLMFNRKEFRANKTVEEFYTAFLELYASESMRTELKSIIFKSQIEMIVNEALEKEESFYSQISEDADNAWYHFAKGEK